MQCRKPGFNSSVGKIPEERLATHSSILAYRIPWTEEPSRQQSVGSQRVRQDLATNSFTFKCLLFALEISLSYPGLLPEKSTCLHLMKPLRTSREFFTAFLHGSQSSAPQWKFCTSWKTFSAVLPWIHFQLTASTNSVILCSCNNILPIPLYVPSMLHAWWSSMALSAPAAVLSSQGI